MLTDLDAVNWGELRDAYGSAEAIPKLLQRVATGDESALEELGNRVNHQGTPMPIAAQVAPFAIELLASGDAPIAPLLLWLGELAAGGDHTRLLARGTVSTQEHPLRDVVAHADAIESHLTSEHAPVRAAAAFTVCWSGRDTAGLEAAFQAESDDAVRASQLLALGLRGVDVLSGSTTGELTQVCKQIVAAYIGGAPLSDDDQLELMSIIESGVTASAIPFCSGDLYAFAALALTRLATRSDDHALFELILASTEGQPTRPVVAARMLDAAFDDVPDGPRTAHQLSTPQRKALEAVSDAKMVVTARAALAANGLPQGDANMNRFLGRAPAGPLDTMVEGEPLWRHLADRIAERRTHEQWLKDVGTRDAWAICEDAATGPYNVHLPWPRPLNPTNADHQRWLGRLHDVLVATLADLADPTSLMASAEALLPNAGRPTRHHAALLVAAIATHAELPEQLDPLLRAAMTDEAYAESMRSVLRTLPLARRRSFVDALEFRHGGLDGVIWFKDKWCYVDALEADEAIASTLAIIRDGNLPLPKQRAVEILTAFGDQAHPLLEEALCTLDGQRREIVAEAMAALVSRDDHDNC